MSPLRKCTVCGRDLGPPTTRGRPTTVCSARCTSIRKTVQREQSRQRAVQRGCPPDKHGTCTGYTQYRCSCLKCMAWSRNYKATQRSKQEEATVKAHA